MILMREAGDFMSKQAMIDEVSVFIQSFDGGRDNFLHGNCYWFARILYTRFAPFYHCEIMYHPIENHFAILIQNILFDASGKLSDKYPYKGWTKWSAYLREEPIGAQRVIRDCAWHIDPDDWKNFPKHKQKIYLSQSKNY